MTAPLSMILRYTAEGASSRVRGFELAGVMRSNGTDVSILSPDDSRWRRRYYGSAVSPRPLYIQKRASERDVGIARVRRALRLTTVFDLDDAPGGVAEDPAQEALVARMMQLASAVTVGGHALHAFASRHNDTVEIIPSAVDTGLFTPARRTGDVVTIGWIGDGAGYGEELMDLARIVGRVRERERVRVLIVGAVGTRKIHEAFRHDDDIVIDSVEWRREESIVEAMREFDIGVYPLRDTLYNSFKCGYKAVQYMALGIPVVASPTGETPFIVRDGVSGRLPRHEDEWVERLCELIDDGPARARLGEAGREMVVARYSLVSAAASLGSLLERLTNRRRRGVVAAGLLC